MFSNNFAPFAILQKNEVKQDINDIIKKVQDNNTLKIGDVAARATILHLAHLSTAWANALGKINEWQDKKELNKFHISQLNYLLNHQGDIKNVLESNLAVSAIINFQIYSISQIGKNVTDGLNMFWYALKYLSFDKGFEESQMEVNSRRERNMWNILLSPIALLMNQKYNIGKNKNLCDDLLANIVEQGCLYSDVDSLCTDAVFKSFMNSPILHYFKKDKYGYKKYIDLQNSIDFCDTIDSHIDFFLSVIEDKERIGL